MLKSRLILVSLLVASCHAAADLYISPVVEPGTVVSAPAEGSVSTPSKGLSGIPMETPALSVKVTYSSLSEAERALSTESARPIDPAPVKDQHFGSNIPLVVALKHLIPDLDHWRVNLEEGMERRVVSWSGGSDWRGALAAIASQNSLSIIMNGSENAVGVASTEESARALAKRIPDIWHAPAGQSVREVLQAWTERSGWQLIWDDALPDRCRVAADLVIRSPFHESVDRLVSTACGADAGLRRNFYLQNKVLHVSGS